MDKIKRVIFQTAEALHRRKNVVLALSCLVVFITTYMLILPAFTLEKDEAVRQGGIDVPSVETTAKSGLADGDVPEAVSDEEDMSAADGDIQNAGDAYSSGETLADEDADIEDDEADMSEADGDAEISVDADENTDDADTDDENASADSDAGAIAGNDAETGESYGDAAEDAAAELEDEAEAAADPDALNEDAGAQTADSLTFEGDGFTVSVDDTHSVLPGDTQLAVEELIENPTEGTKAERREQMEAYKAYCDQAIAAINEESKGKANRTISFAKLYDISLQSSGEEISPDKPVDVTISYDKKARKDLKVDEAADVRIIHFAQDEKTEEVTAELIDEDAVDVTLEKSRMAEAAFEAESFSVYAVIYTVDFHYEVNGEKYDYSFGGGETDSLRNIIDKLHVYETVDKDVAADLGAELTAETFLQDVEKVEFSDEDLVKVARITEDTTAGELNKALDIEPEYSAELTEEDIKELESRALTAPDWALISLKPFDTEETLTVTMKNGDVFTISVTDAQDPLGLDGKRFAISYNGIAMMGEVDHMTWPGGQRYAFPSGNKTNEKAAWTFEYDESTGKYYLKAYDGRYFRYNWENNRESSNVALSERRNASPLSVQYNDDGSYSIGTSSSNLISYYENGSNPAYFCGSSQGYGDPQTGLVLTEYISGPSKNRLIYLDEDNTKITIGVGDSLTLRPYGEWYWKNDDQPDNLKSKSWTFDNENWVHPSPKTDTRSEDSKTYTTTYYKIARDTNGVIEFEGYSKWDDQLKEFYSVYHGIAKKQGTFTLTNSAGKTITVTVVESSSDKPPVVAKTSSIPVNLFNYDKNKVLDPSDDSNQNNATLKYDTVNQRKYGSLKFLSSGSGSQGHNINDYSYDKANSGILNPDLPRTGANAGYPKLSDNNGSHSLKYLFDTRNKKWGTYNANSDSWTDGNDMIAYPDVEGLFQQDTDGFYYFNSNSNYAYYDGERIVLYDHTYTQVTKGTGVENGKPIGFFPFHNYNSTNDLYVNQNSKLDHHIGMSMDLDFEIPEGRKNNGKDIVFEFSGDDDMWVFIDNELVLDIGGIHQPVRGKIDFTNGKIYVYGKDTVTKTFNVGEHNMKLFYLERGGCDSNCSIKFNLPVYKTLDLSKRLNGLTAGEWEKYKDEEFTYELKVNGALYSSPEGAANKQSLQAQRIGADGMVKEYFIITNGQITIRHGETVRIPHLSPSDTFYVAEEKSLNMDQFETPHAERDYYLVSDGQEHEEEILLKEGHTTGAATNLSDWYTPEYKVNDTEKVTFTNTLKEKDLEVEKIWKGGREHPDEVKFTVQATARNLDGSSVPYTVSSLKDGQNDKVFTLNASNGWKTTIDHLPILTPDGKFIIYEVTEQPVSGYVSIVKDKTESETRCNVDAVKLWPDDSARTEVIKIKLRNSAGKYYAGEDENGNAYFNDSGTEYELTPSENYIHRFSHLPKNDKYTLEQIGDQDESTQGLVTYVRTIVDFDIENEPISGPVDPTGPQDNPEIHKRIDALRDKITNPDSAHSGEDLTDLYRLYLDYKINSMQDANGVDLLFVIDHSGSMNNNAWQGNRHRAESVMDALNGQNGIISEFLKMNARNQWAAVGFKGDDGKKYYDIISLFPFIIGDTGYRADNAGANDSEVLSPWDGRNYTWNATPSNISLHNEGADRLTDYTAGFWRAEQFLTQEDTKKDGRKKVVVFISDGIPTLHIPDLGNSLSGAGTARGSRYYRDADGGCPEDTLEQFGYFVRDMKNNGYTFGDNMEFYTIGFGGTMQTANGEKLLKDMLASAYGDSDHTGNFMTITDVDPYQQYNSTAAEQLKRVLRILTGMSESFTNITISDDLSKYVDLYGLSDAGSDSAAILNAAKAKVTMTDPSDPTKTKVLYENGAIIAENNSTAEGKQILSAVTYDAGTKKVTATFDKDYKAQPGITYTLSFDVKATEEAYKTYANAGYDKDNDDKVIRGDKDTDFLGTDPDNATSVDKDGFHSNDAAKTTYAHNGEPEDKTYPHPVIQVSTRIDIVKVDQSGDPLSGAKFILYDKDYDASTTAAENAGHIVKNGLESKQESGAAATSDAYIYRGKLEQGTYYLVETENPSGYNSLEGPVKIEVTMENEKPKVKASINGIPVDGSMLTKDTQTGVWKLTIMNSAGVELPHTGGIGTTQLYIFGSMLVIGCGVLLVMRRRTHDHAE